jgi:2-hydroxychromene-2-carboxylate isomerase
MTLSVDLFWSFRSPYSYLATGRIVALTRDYDLQVNVRPVYPIAIRNPAFFQRVDPLWVAYLRRDVERIAEHAGIPFGWPRPDPVVMDMRTRVIAADQPYIHRLTRLGIEAAMRGRGLAFIDEVSRLVWDGAVSGWHQGNHLAHAVERAGLALEAMDAVVAARPASFDAVIAENQQALEQAGHWGVPTLAFQGEPFFGQDRIDLCVWRMRQHGLTRRDR